MAEMRGNETVWSAASSATQFRLECPPDLIDGGNERLESVGSNHNHIGHSGRLVPGSFHANMNIFQSQAPSVGRFPDDLDLYTFMFDFFPSYRFRPQGTGHPLLIDEETGQGWTFEDTQHRVDLLAVGLREKLGISE